MTHPRPTGTVLRSEPTPGYRGAARGLAWTVGIPFKQLTAAIKARWVRPALTSGRMRREIAEDLGIGYRP